MDGAEAGSPSVEEILRGLEESGADVLRAAAALGEDEWERGRYEGGWNARQLLAHIASIEWSYPRVIDLAREARSGDGDGEASMRGGNDAYNQRQIARRAEASVEALVEEFRRNREATIVAVRAAEPELWTIPVRSAGGIEGPLGRVFWRVAVEHVRNHARDLARPAGRLPYLRREDLDDAGLKVWDALVDSRGQHLVNEAGGLVGPFNAWVHAPGTGRRLSGLGATLRFETSLERRLLELAIIVVAAHWRAEFEWWAHARMAREHGVDDRVVAAVQRGETPSFEADDEALVYTFARQLVTGGRVDDATYAAAVGLLGHRGVVELVSLCGYYTLVSFTLNAFDVPLPAGVAPAWP